MFAIPLCLAPRPQQDREPLCDRREQHREDECNAGVEMNVNSGVSVDLSGSADIELCVGLPHEGRWLGFMYQVTR